MTSVVFSISCYYLRDEVDDDGYGGEWGVLCILFIIVVYMTTALLSECVNLLLVY